MIFQQIVTLQIQTLGFWICEKNHVIIVVLQQ